MYQPWTGTASDNKEYREKECTKLMIVLLTGIDTHILMKIIAVQVMIMESNECQWSGCQKTNEIYFEFLSTSRQLSR